jgi:hypothetical protein
MGSKSDEEGGLPTVDVLEDSSHNLEETAPSEYRLYKRRFIGLVGMVS